MVDNVYKVIVDKTEFLFIVNINLIVTRYFKSEIKTHSFTIVSQFIIGYR